MIQSVAISIIQYVKSCLNIHFDTKIFGFCAFKFRGSRTAGDPKAAHRFGLKTDAWDLCQKVALLVVNK